MTRKRVRLFWIMRLELILQSNNKSETKPYLWKFKILLLRSSIIMKFYCFEILTKILILDVFESIFFFYFHNSKINEKKN